jgi:hypothetical protein
MDETSINTILEYGRLIYETGRYDEARIILMEFFKISYNNRKNLNKALLGIWLVFAIDILEKNWERSLKTFNLIKDSIENLKLSLEEDFKKINFESV